MGFLQEFLGLYGAWLGSCSASNVNLEMLTWTLENGQCDKKLPGICIWTIVLQMNTGRLLRQKSVLSGFFLLTLTNYNT